MENSAHNIQCAILCRGWWNFSRLSWNKAVLKWSSTTVHISRWSLRLMFMCQKWSSSLQSEVKIPPGNLLIRGSTIKGAGCCREVAIACRNSAPFVLICTYTVKPICFVPYFRDIWVVLNPRSLAAIFVDHLLPRPVNVPCLFVQTFCFIAKREKKSSDDLMWHNCINIQ